MVPNIVFAPNIRRTQNTDTGRKTQTQLITGFKQCELILSSLPAQIVPITFIHSETTLS